MNNNNQQNNLDGERRKGEKRIARELQEKKERQKRAIKKFLYALVSIGVIFFLIRGIMAQFPKGGDYSQVFSDLGRNHVAEGSVVSVYNSNPPTSGPHYPSPANAGFYDGELPDERVVHNLEHGNVWISYKLDLSQDVIKALRKFAGGSVIVTARSLNDTDVALAAWGRLDKFDVGDGELDAQRIRDFILRYQNRGPESIGAQGNLR